MSMHSLEEIKKKENNKKSVIFRQSITSVKLKNQKDHNKDLQSDFNKKSQKSYGKMSNSNFDQTKQYDSQNMIIQEMNDDNKDLLKDMKDLSNPKMDGSKKPEQKQIKKHEFLRSKTRKIKDEQNEQKKKKGQTLNINVNEKLIFQEFKERLFQYVREQENSPKQTAKESQSDRIFQATGQASPSKVQKHVQIQKVFNQAKDDNSSFFTNQLSIIQNNNNKIQDANDSIESNKDEKNIYTSLQKQIFAMLKEKNQKSTDAQTNQLKEQILSKLQLQNKNSISPKEQNNYFDNLKLSSHNKDFTDKVANFLQQNYDDIFQESKFEKLEQSKHQFLTKLAQNMQTPITGKQDRLSTIFFDQIQNFQKSTLSQTSNDLAQIFQKAQKQGALALLSGIPKNKFLTRKMQMIKKLDEVTDQRRQKQKKLDLLYLELQQATNVNLAEELSQFQITQKFQKKQQEWNDSLMLSLSQNKAEEKLIDETLKEHQFNFRNIESLYERKELLTRKLQNVQHQILEEESINQSYLEKIKNQTKDNLSLLNVNKEIEANELDVQKVVNDLEIVQYIKGQRKHQLESLNYELKTKIQIDKEKMDKMIEEKQIQYKGEEQETQIIIYNMLQHVRNILKINQQMKVTQQLKMEQYERFQEVLKEFKERQKEIYILSVYWQLQNIQKYTLSMDNIQSENDNPVSNDQQRLKGLMFIEQFKEESFEIKYNQNFEIIYPTRKQIYERKKKRLSDHQAEQKTQMSSNKNRLNKSLNINTVRSSIYSKNSQTSRKQSPLEELRSKRVQSITGHSFYDDLQNNKENKLRSEIVIENDERLSQNKRQSNSIEHGLSQKSLIIPYNPEDLSSNRNFSPLNVQQQLDLYLQNKDKFDKFFIKLIQIADSIDKDTIISSYNQSSIKLASLYQSFKTIEKERQIKQMKIPFLIQKFDFLKNELLLINKYISSLKADQEINLVKFNKQKMQLTDDDKIIFMKQNQLQAQSESNSLIFYPISVEGMKQFIDQLMIKIETIKKFRFESESKIKQFLNDFRYFFTQSIKKAYTIQNLNVQKQDENNNFIIIDKLYKKYFSKKKFINKADFNKSLKANILKQNLKLKQLKDSAENEQALSYQTINSFQNISMNLEQNNLMDSYSKRLNAFYIEKIDIATELSQEQIEIQGDLMQLYQILSKEVDVLKVYHNIKAQNLSHIDKQQIQKLEEFNPVFRKSEFHNIKRAAMKILNIDIFQYGQPASGKFFGSKLTAKQIENLKLKAEQKQNNQMILFDQDQNDFAIYAAIEGKKQKSLNQKKKESIEVEAKSDGSDKEVDDSKNIINNNKAKKFQELQNKIDNYIQVYKNKNQNQQKKNDLYKIKQNVQIMQRSEQFFIKDLKQKINSRYDILKQSFTSKYQAKHIFSNEEESQVYQKSPRKNFNENTSQHNEAQQNQREANNLVSATQSRLAKTGYGNRIQLQEINSRNYYRSNCISPNLENYKEIDLQNLSQKKRTNNLYSSLVETTSNINHVRSKNFKDPISQKLLQTLGLKIKSSRDAKDSQINKSQITLQSSFKKFKNELLDVSDSADLKKLQTILSQKFADYSKVKSTQHSMNQRQSIISNQVNTIGSPQFQNHFMISFNRNNQNKKPYTASLKERIQINRDITKSVKTKQRAPDQNSSFNNIQKFPVNFSNKTSIQENAKFQTVNQSLYDEPKKYLPFRNTFNNNENGFAKVKNRLIIESNEESLKKFEIAKNQINRDIQINQKIENFESLTKKNNLSGINEKQKQNWMKTQVFTQNQAFNLIYNTQAQQLKKLKEQKKQ